MAIKTKNLKQKLRASQGLVLIAVLVLGFGGFALYRWYSVHAEKQQFEQAKASLDSLYKDIVAEVGAPGNIERTQACGYASRKFERGPRTCGDYLYFAYGVSGPQQATELTNKLSESIKQNDNFIVTFSDSEEYLPYTELRGPYDQQETGIDMKENESSFSCGVEFTYANSNDDSHAVSVKSSEYSLSVIASCQSGAKAEHYPTKP